MRIGTLLTFNPTEQIIGAGFKALIDQNKLIIRQNELLLRELRKLNETKEKRAKRVIKRKNCFYCWVSVPLVQFRCSSNTSTH